MSKSPAIIDRDDIGEPADWLYNDHAGEMLALEFMEPLALSAADLALCIGVPTSSVTAVLEGKVAMDAELDLRLARYFRMSECFFLRLQTQYELLEARRALNGALDRIVPRAA